MSESELTKSAFVGPYDPRLYYVSDFEGERLIQARLDARERQHTRLMLLDIAKQLRAIRKVKEAEFEERWKKKAPAAEMSEVVWEKESGEESEIEEVVQVVDKGKGKEVVAEAEEGEDEETMDVNE